MCVNMAVAVVSTLKLVATIAASRQERRVGACH